MRICSAERFEPASQGLRKEREGFLDEAGIERSRAGRSAGFTLYVLSTLIFEPIRRIEPASLAQDGGE